MPHQCTKCGKVYPDAAGELLSGCGCGSRFFYYIRQEKFDSLQGEVQKVMEELEKADKDQIEKDIRELTGLDKRPDEPVILDLETVKVLKPGKFEIDIVSLFSKNRPLIYKLGEGKYIIDIASSLGTKEAKDKIRDQAGFLDEVEEELEVEENKESKEEEEESEEDVNEGDVSEENESEEKLIIKSKNVETGESDEIESDEADKIEEANEEVDEETDGLKELE